MKFDKAYFKNINEGAKAKEILAILKKFPAEAKRVKGKGMISDKENLRLFDALDKYFNKKEPRRYAEAQMKGKDAYGYIEDAIDDVYSGDFVSYESYNVDEATTKMGVVARNVKKGTPPYTIVAIVKNKVVKQETTKVSTAVPAFVRELQKEFPNAKISVEDKGGRVVHSESIEIEEGGMGNNEDPYTVKYWYDRAGRIMVAVLKNEKDAKKFLKNVKGLGMGGQIVKGATKEALEESINEAVMVNFNSGVHSAQERWGRVYAKELVDKFKKAKVKHQTDNRYYVKFDITSYNDSALAKKMSVGELIADIQKKDGRIDFSERDSMGRIKRMEHNEDRSWKHYLQEGVRLPKTIDEVKMTTLYVMFQAAVIKKEKTLPLGSPIAVQVMEGLNEVSKILKKNMSLTGKAAVVAFLDAAQGPFSASFPAIAYIARKYKLKVDNIADVVDTSKIKVNESIDEKKKDMIKVKLKKGTKIGYTITSPGPDGKPGKVLKRKNVPGKKDVSDQYIAGLKEAVDQHTVKELVLYITNDSQLYRSRTTSIVKNLAKKVGKGTYDGLLAIKAFMYLAVDGIKKYEKEMASPGWAKAINKQTKQAIASELLDYYLDEIGE